MDSTATDSSISSQPSEGSDLSESIGMTPKLDRLSLQEDQITGTPNKLDENQKKLLAQLRQNIMSDSSVTESQKLWCDDWCLCRYLRARSWDLGKAETMLRESFKWRAENKIDNIRCDEVESQIVMGHMYNFGRDKYGRPVVVLRVHTERDPHDENQKLRFMIYSMERSIRIMDTKTTGVEKMVWVVSCKGYNFKYNGEVGFAKSLLNVLQNHYPERLGMLIVVDPPFVFRAFWKMVYPFIDANTKKKILFVSGNDAEKRKLIGEFIELSQLSKSLFAGDAAYEFNGKEYVEGLKKEEAKLPTPK